jgi:hypothetical protein
MAGQPPTPPPIDRPPTAFENPEDIPSPERADQIFESHKAASAEPTRDDWFEVLMHLSEVRWLGGETQQCPVAPAFGAENELIRAVRKPDSPEPDESTRRLDPAIEADRIVGRQLTEYTSTMTRVCRGVEDTGKLVGLVAKHAGRRQVATHQLARYESPTSSFNTEGYSIAASPEGMTVTNPSDPLPEFLRYDAPNGEIHLVHRDGSQRYNANIKGGQLDVKHEAVHGVRPEDAEYLAELGKDLKTYQELLLQVADHAGIDRQRVINPRTGLVPLDVEVDTKIANPSLQATLPEALRTKMKAFSQVIAARVNSSQMEGGFDEMAFRLGEYFSAVARNRSFHDR